MYIHVHPSTLLLQQGQRYMYVCKRLSTEYKACHANHLSDMDHFQNGQEQIHFWYEEGRDNATLPLCPNHTQTWTHIWSGESQLTYIQGMPRITIHEQNSL